MTGEIEYGKTYVFDEANQVYPLSAGVTLLPRYSLVFDGGDYDRHHLPGVNDFTYEDSLDLVKQERRLLAKETGYPESKYLIVISYATPWQVVDE